MIIVILLIFSVLLTGCNTYHNDDDIAVRYIKTMKPEFIYNDNMTSRSFTEFSQSVTNVFVDTPHVFQESCLALLGYFCDTRDYSIQNVKIIDAEPTQDSGELYYYNCRVDDVYFKLYYVFDIDAEKYYIYIQED